MPEEIGDYTGKSAVDIASESGQRKRQVAYRLRINEINNAIISENKSFFEIDGKKVARVNLISTIIDKFLSEGEKRFASLTVDDGSNQIRVKVFGEDVEKFSQVDIGDTILIVGFIKFFNNETYILPEIIKKVDEKWLLVRKNEIAKNESTRKEENKQTSREQIQSIAFRKTPPMKIESEKLAEEIEDKEDSTINDLRVKEEILKILKEKEEGVDVETLILTIKAEVKTINDSISDLLDEAVIYEPKPGYIRLL